MHMAAAEDAGLSLRLPRRTALYTDICTNYYCCGRLSTKKEVPMRNFPLILRGEKESDGCHNTEIGAFLCHPYPKGPKRYHIRHPSRRIASSSAGEKLEKR